MTRSAALLNGVVGCARSLSRRATDARGVAWNAMISFMMRLL